MYAPSPKLPNYLRSHRKRLNLSQDEVAFLLGTLSGARVCRDERFAREPSLATALAYEAIFQKPARELFGGLYDQIAHEVADRAKVLGDQLGRQNSNRSATRSLQEIIDAISRDSHADVNQ